MQPQRVIIIGAGVGGLATGILLAKSGYRVTILEKNKVPGGRCQKLVRNGYTFDTGPTMYLFPRMFAQFFETIGENIADYLQLRRVNPTYRLHFVDGVEISLTSDREKMRRQLEQIEPGSFARFQKYLQAGKAHMELCTTRLAANPLEHFGDFFNLGNFWALLKTGAIFGHYGYVRRFFSHPALLAAFTFQDSYLSLHPYHAQSIYSLFPYSELQEGSFLPVGGMSGITEMLVKIAQKLKVEIVCNQEVNKINLSEKKATGVTLLNGETVVADIVVVNSDLGYSYARLLPDKNLANKFKRKKYSCSAVVFHWGLDRKYPKFHTHNLFFAPDYKRGFDEVLNSLYPPPNPHFYVQVPTRTDSTRAPKDGEVLTVMVPINHLDPKHPVDWQNYAKRLRKYVLARLNGAGYGEIENHIKFEKQFLPTDWESHFNLTYGAIYGLDHNLWQMGYFRPHRQHTNYRNVYFVGSGTHPGSGLPTVLLSAQHTTAKILQTDVS